jgi:hypothetical protein
MNRWELFFGGGIVYDSRELARGEMGIENVWIIIHMGIVIVTATLNRSCVYTWDVQLFTIARVIKIK